MSLSPTNFVAENVTLFVKYMEEDKPKWYFGHVDKVLQHGEQDGHHFVDIEIAYGDDDTTTFETLWDYDYEADTEDSWRFTNKYKPLVNQVLDILEVQAIEHEIDGLDEEGTDDEEDDEDDDEYDEEDDSDDSDDSDDTDEVEYIYQRKPRSFLNKFFATIWTFSPLIASFVVVYNARDNIATLLRNKYC